LSSPDSRTTNPDSDPATKNDPPASPRTTLSPRPSRRLCRCGLPLALSLSLALFARGSSKLNVAPSIGPPRPDSLLAWREPRLSTCLVFRSVAHSHPCATRRPPRTARHRRRHTGHHLDCWIAASCRRIRSNTHTENARRQVRCAVAAQLPSPLVRPLLVTVTDTSPTGTSVWRSP
jgi:hypothetical protein